MDILSLATTVGSAFVVTFVTTMIPNPSTLAARQYAVSEGTRAAAVLPGAVLLWRSVAAFG